MNFNGKRTDKPWGHEILWANGKDYLGKVLYIHPGQKLSLQYHEVKEETIICLEGVITISADKDGPSPIVLHPGQTLHVFPRQIHRFENNTNETVILMEVSSNHPQDVVRIQDNYGRV